MAGDPKEPTFEQALERLEAIVRALEGGELALEDALAQYETGVGLARRCAEDLHQAEARIERLRRDAAGVLGTEPLVLDGDATA